ncbi:transposase, Ptta/En/Spm [Tanacetum coccineum]
MSAMGDRGWMYKRRNNEGRLCSYYQSKVNEFLNFAFQIERVVEKKMFGSDAVFRIKCPCSKCKIKVFKKRDEVKLDLWHKGFIRGYTTWYAHGERKCRRAEIGSSEPIEEDNDYDNGSRSGGRARGISGNIGGRGSSSTSGFGNPDADFDTNDNETETETSQRVRGSNLVQSIPNHPSQRPMITLYYGGFAEPHVTRDIISIFKVMFYGPWATWREVDQESRDYMFEEFQIYWGRMSKGIIAAHRATLENFPVGKDLSVLSRIPQVGIDQAHWEKT